MMQCLMMRSRMIAWPARPHATARRPSVLPFSRFVLCLATVTACDGLVTKPSLYGVVSATVQRRSGQPVPGVGLVLYTGPRPMGYAVTDSTGSFTFVDVPEGTYGVRAAVPSGYLRYEDIASSPPTDVVDQLVVRGQQQLDARFSFLKEGVGTIVARVTEPDGTPVPQIAVILYASRGALRRAVTDASGMFSFDGVPHGNYGVFAERPVLYLDSGETSLPSRAGLIVDDGSRETTAFLFAKCVGSITARILDNTGAAVPGALLSVYTGAAKLSESPVGDDGSRVFGNLVCTDYGVRVRIPMGWTATEGRGTTFADGLRIRRGSTLSATLTLTRIPRATIRVRIIDQRGAPVPNARVVLYTGAGLVRDVVTNIDGTVTVSDILTDSEYGLRVVNPSGYVAVEGRGTTFEDGLRLTEGPVREFLFRFFKP